MSNAQSWPRHWSEAELAEDSFASMGHFREVRVQEPLEAYLESFDEARIDVKRVLAETDALQNIDSDPRTLLGDPSNLAVVRYLASPAISADDLKVLAEASLTPSRLKSDPDMAERVIKTVMLGIDVERFPWLSDEREPTDSELTTAVVSTAALMATQKVQTSRRNQAKLEQEEAVAEVLRNNGFTEVSRRTVGNVGQLPEPGEFCAESLFGSRKADLVIRLWDGRAMPTECKVSNSSTNSVKRLNNDAAAKAKTWIQEFGTATCIPTAVLSGVFKVHNLRSAQDDGLAIFWAHRLDAMIDFIESTKR